MAWGLLPGILVKRSVLLSFSSEFWWTGLRGAHPKGKHAERDEYEVACLGVRARGLGNPCLREELEA